MLFPMNLALRASGGAGSRVRRLAWLVASSLVALAPRAWAGGSDGGPDTAAGSWFDEPAESPESPAGPTDFEPVLDPHGSWIEHSTYGRLWVPDREVVGVEFAPYVTEGHWDLNEGGDWVWVSDYPFGWVVFHYGRWVWTSSHGWAWVPGRRYAPAWVVWRVPAGGYSYIGWAPAPPRYVWRHGRAVRLRYRPSAYYVFAPSRYVFSYQVHRHIVDQPRRAARPRRARASRSSSSERPAAKRRVIRVERRRALPGADRPTRRVDITRGSALERGKRRTARYRPPRSIRRVDRADPPVRRRAAPSGRRRIERPSRARRVDKTHHARPKRRYHSVSRRAARPKRVRDEPRRIERRSHFRESK